MRRQLLPSILITSAVALVILVVFRLGGWWPMRLVNDQIFNPIGRSFRGLGIQFSDGVELIKNINNLARTNAQQASEILELKKQLSSLKEVANENEQLRAQLQFTDVKQSDLVAARAVGSDPDAVRRYLTIDRGSSSGLKKGMAVLSNGIFIGILDDVNDYSSRVFLVSDPEFRLRAIGQDSRSQGLIQGQLGRGLLYDKVAQSETIGIGEYIITAGSDMVPKGLLIGQVQQINRADNAVFQSAIVHGLVDPSRAELVFVVRASQ